MSGGGFGGQIGKGNWADPTGTIQKSGLSKFLDPLGFTKVDRPGESAADRAQRLEEERQARIADTQKRINAVFDSSGRAADIADVVAAVRERDIGDLDRQKADVDRALRFALARGGQIGGSTQRDQQQGLGEEYGRSLLNVEQRALGVGSDLEARDQDARARLIQLATQGLDATTAASQSAAALRSNLESGRATAYGQQLGDYFTGAGTFIKQANEAAARRRANQDAQLSLYGGQSAGGFT